MRISGRFIKKIIFSFIAILSLAIVFLPGQFLGIPPLSQLIEIIKGYYANYGEWIVFFGAFLESILYVSWNFPGSIIVILGAAFSGMGVVSFPVIIILAIIGFTLGYIINYFLGYYGYYKLFQKIGLKPIDNVLVRLKKKGMLALFLFYIQPQLGVFSSTACGIMRIAFRKFLITTLISVIFWSLFWGILAYFVGSTLLNYTDALWFRILVSLVIIGMAFILIIPEKKSKSRKN